MVVNFGLLCSVGRTKTSVFSSSVTSVVILYSRKTMQPYNSPTSHIPFVTSSHLRVSALTCFSAYTFWQGTFTSTSLSSISFIGHILPLHSINPKWLNLWACSNYYIWFQIWIGIRDRWRLGTLDRSWLGTGYTDPAGQRRPSLVVQMTEPACNIGRLWV